MKIRILLPVVLLVLAVSQGCVSNKKYAELQANYNKSLDTNSKLRDLGAIAHLLEEHRPQGWGGSALHHAGDA